MGRGIVKLQRLNSIQYLRGLAACMVVLFHTLPHQIGVVGAAGVDIFFVISGFIMWAVAISKPTSPQTFIRDRFVRIVPLYWFYTLLLVAAALVAPGAFSKLQFNLGRLLCSLFFVPQIDPYSGKTLPILAQGWTLNYEIFFYCLVALALAIPFRTKAPLIGAILALLTLVGWMAGPARPVWMTFCDPILLEFLAGIAIGVIWSRGLLPGRRWALALLATAIACFAISAASGEPTEKFRVLAWGGPSALLVIGLLSIETLGALPQLPLMSRVGDASYSIYLTHEFIVSAILKIGGDVSSSPAATIATAAFLSVVCVAGGWLAYKLIEAPLLLISRRGSNRLPLRSAYSPGT